MRTAKQELLSRYAFGDLPLERIRDFVEKIDWDDRAIPKRERDILLTVETILVGIEEGFSGEDELKEYLASEIAAPSQP